MFYWWNGAPFLISFFLGLLFFKGILKTLDLVVTILLREKNKTKHYVLTILYVDWLQLVYFQFIWSSSSGFIDFWMPSAQNGADV